MATCRGIDVSSFQGVQDWTARKAEGIVFAFAKASEGMHSRDGRFDTHIKGIKAAGLVPGAYHFAWPNQDVAAEAANYIAAVKPHAGRGFTHWLDLERYSDGRNYAGRTNAQIQAWAKAWLAAVTKAFPGQRVGVYTSGSDLASGHVPAGATLWYPQYPGTGVDTYTEAEAHAQPKPSGHAPLFWQFTSTPIDRSICYKSAADLRTWAGGATTTPAPAPKPTTKPVVDLSKLIAAAKTDPHASQGHVTYRDGVHLVEAALYQRGFLASKYAGDGSYGTTTVTGFAKFQRWYSNQHHLGWTSADCNGIPGKTSLTALGQLTGKFTVTS